jgi:hypothetical protein
MPTTTRRRIDQEEDVLSVSEERSDLRTAERREVLPGLPGGPGLDREPLEVRDELLDALLSGARTTASRASTRRAAAEASRRPHMPLAEFMDDAEARVRGEAVVGSRVRGATLTNDRVATSAGAP